MRLSVQLYTLRDDLSKDVLGTLQQVREIGFEYVELAGFFDKSVDEWESMLGGLGLKANGMHVGIDAMESDFAGSTSALNQLGAKYAIIPWLNPEQRGNWEGLGKKLDELGVRTKAAGLQLAYHNHDFEFVDNGLEKLFASCSPENVKSELDLAWVQIGGAQPEMWIRKLSDRLPLVHLKDYDPTANPQWVPGGEGDVNWGTILPACEEVGVEFGVIELDAYAGAPMDAVRKSFEYFSAKGLA